MARFTNQAQLTYQNAVVNSNVAVGELQEVFSAKKTAVLSRYRRNDGVTYVISMVNTGTLPLTELQIADDLGGYPLDNAVLYPLTYIDGSLRAYVNGIETAAAPAAEAGPPLVIHGLTVPAGGNLILLYEARVNEFAPPEPEGSIVNTAVVSGGGLAAPITLTADIFAREEAELTITKTVEPTTVAENGTLTYTFLIQNHGNTAATAADRITLTDTFDPLLRGVTVTLDGVALTDTQYTYDTVTGQLATVPGQITVPAAAYTQDALTGAYVTTPGVAVLRISGTI